MYVLCNAFGLGKSAQSRFEGRALPARSAPLSSADQLVDQLVALRHSPSLEPSVITSVSDDLLPLSYSHIGQVSSFLERAFSSPLNRTSPQMLSPPSPT